MKIKKYRLPLVVIVGPTASGKTSLAVELARQYNGEIVCADSRTIYKDMNIGTAKPSLEEQSLVPHWGIDIASPAEYFSVADFKQYAVDKIAEIRSRGHMPFLVGGTGLYVDAVIFDYQFGAVADNELRANLEGRTLDQLHEYCKNNNIKLPENKKNKRYVIRAIENINSIPTRKSIPLRNTIIVGITTEKTILRTRIQQRAEQLFANGVVDEAIMLGKKYGWEGEAMKSNIYPLIYEYLNDNITLGDAKEKFAILDWRLAKRQLTWLRRNSFIQWLSVDGAKEYLLSQLAIYK